MVMSWRSGGLVLGLVFLVAVALVKPIGLSTQFVILDGILLDAMAPETVVESADAKSGYASPNAYLDKSGGAYAAEVAKPLNYNFVFVLAMIGGAALSGALRGFVPRAERTMPRIWRANSGEAPWKRHVAVFVSGVLVLYGARLAGGCTSGHMMSGMMQTAVSGYIFAAGAFLAAIPTAFYLFGKEE